MVCDQSPNARPGAYPWQEAEGRKLRRASRSRSRATAFLVDTNILVYAHDPRDLTKQ